MVVTNSNKLLPVVVGLVVVSGSVVVGTTVVVATRKEKNKYFRLKRVLEVNSK